MLVPLQFLERLREAQLETNSLLCVGLDPDPSRFPQKYADLETTDAVRGFCQKIIEATAPFACAFKPNLAFFEALGAEGWGVLEDVIAAVPENRIVVLDGKRGDIGNTASMYAEAMYNRLGGHAATVAPYMGEDSITPFLKYGNTCAFVLVATSNPSGVQVQHLLSNGLPLYKHIARMAFDAGAVHPGTVGFVVGATQPEMLADLRSEFSDIPFLIPGIGAQGGNISATLQANAHGPALINTSRSILYASSGQDFAEVASHIAEGLANQMSFQR